MKRGTLLALVGAAALLGVLLLARASGARASARAIAIAAQQDTIKQLRAQVRRDSVVIDSMAKAAFATAAPHETAQRTTDTRIAELRNLQSAARAAAARDSLELEEARALLLAFAARGDSLILAIGAERTAGVTRIAALERTVTYAVTATGTASQLAEAQGRLAAQLLRRRPWWQRALDDACTAGLTASGAGGGALVGGPAGAAIGSVLGFTAGRLACP